MSANFSTLESHIFKQVNNAMAEVARQYEDGTIAKFNQEQEDEMVRINDRLESFLIKKNYVDIDKELALYKSDWLKLLKSVN